MMRIIVITYCLIVMTSASAKTIHALHPRASGSITAGEEFFLHIAMPEISIDDRCGIELEWGDGTKEDVIFGLNEKFKPVSNKVQAIFQIPHTYKSSGVKVINAKSKFWNGCDIDSLVDSFPAKVITAEEKRIIEIRQKEERLAKLIREANELVEQESRQQESLYKVAEEDQKKAKQIQKIQVQTQTNDRDTKYIKSLIDSLRKSPWSTFKIFAISSVGYGGAETESTFFYDSKSITKISDYGGAKGIKRVLIFEEINKGLDASRKQGFPRNYYAVSIIDIACSNELSRKIGSAFFRSPLPSLDAIEVGRDTDWGVVDIGTIESKLIGLICI